MSDRYVGVISADQCLVIICDRCVGVRNTDRCVRVGVIDVLGFRLLINVFGCV